MFKMLFYSHFQVDYFSLDVEGAEEAVLATIPWDKVSRVVGGGQYQATIPWDKVSRVVGGS